MLARDTQIRKEGILPRFQRKRDASRRRAVDLPGFRTADQRRAKDSSHLHRCQGEGHGVGNVKPNGDSVPRQGRQRVQSEEARGIRGRGRGRTTESSDALRSSRSSRSSSRFVSLFASRLATIDPSIGFLPLSLALSSPPCPVSGKCRTVDRGLGLPLAFLARAETFLACNERELALRDLSFVEEMDGDLPDELR